MTRRGALVAPLLCALGCNAAAYDLFVDLETDYVSNVEFGRVEATLELADGTERTLVYDTTGEEDFSEGARIGEIAGIASGEHRLRVRLILPPSVVVDEQTTVLALERSLAVTVLMTRSCAGVECPGPADPATFRQCLGGVCGDERCSDVTPELCGAPTCAADPDCLPTATCATALCDPLRGVCTFPPTRGACPETEWCDPDRGCEPLP